MATEAAAKPAGSAFGFLGHKLGKIPVWVVAVAAVGGYYWYTKYGPGKSSSSAAQGTQGTDPAGNTGTIDPATGFVYGSPEDLAVLGGQSSTTGGGSAGGYQDWQDQQGGSSGGASGGGGSSPAPTPSPSPAPTPPAPAPAPKPAPAPEKKVLVSTPVSTRVKPSPKPARGVAVAPETYVVKKGQTLDQIARQFGLTAAELAGANKYVAGELPGNAKVGQTLGTGAGLKTGQVLTIPKAPTKPVQTKAPKAK